MTDRALRMLYRQAPPVVGCKPGCGQCCGPVPWTPAELARVTDRIPRGTQIEDAPGGPFGVVMLVNPLNPRACPMLDAAKRCTVHADRPLMCRLFGAVSEPRLTCPFGARASRPLTDAKARRLTDAYKQTSAAP